MSKVNKTIELCPPRLLQRKEELTSRVHPCAYCQGNGYFWGIDEQGEGIKKTCPICEGTKEVDALITIEWKASKKI